MNSARDCRAEGSVFWGWPLRVPEGPRVWRCDDGGCRSPRNRWLATNCRLQTSDPIRFRPSTCAKCGATREKRTAPLNKRHPSIWKVKSTVTSDGSTAADAKPMADRTKIHFIASVQMQLMSLSKKATAFIYSSTIWVLYWRWAGVAHKLSVPFYCSCLTTFVLTFCIVTHKTELQTKLRALIIFMVFLFLKILLIN